MAYTFSAKDRLRRIRCFIAGWLRVGRQRRRSKILVVNAQRQSDDNLRYLDAGRSAGSKEKFLSNTFRDSPVTENLKSTEITRRTRETF